MLCCILVKLKLAKEALYIVKDCSKCAFTLIFLLSNKPVQEQDNIFITKRLDCCLLEER